MDPVKKVQEHLLTKGHRVGPSLCESFISKYNGNVDQAIESLSSSLERRKRSQTAAPPQQSLAPKPLARPDSSDDKRVTFLREAAMVSAEEARRALAQYPKVEDALESLLTRDRPMSVPKPTRARNLTPKDDIIIRYAERTVTVSASDYSHRLHKGVVVRPVSTRLYGGSDDPFVKRFGKRFTDKVCEDIPVGGDNDEGSVFTEQMDAIEDFPFSYVLHSVIPQYRASKSDESVDELFALTSECLDCAQRTNRNILTIPITPLRDFGYDVSSACEVVLQAVFLFVCSAPPKSLQRIELFANEDMTVWGTLRQKACELREALAAL